MQTTVVIQNVRVLGMDLNANPTSTQPAVASTATLEVGMPDTEKLALASEAGTLSLALRRPGSVEVGPARPIMADDLGATSSRYIALFHPVKREGRPRAGHEGRLPLIDTGASVTVVNGDAPSSTQVPHEAARAGL